MTNSSSAHFQNDAKSHSYSITTTTSKALCKCETIPPRRYLKTNQEREISDNEDDDIKSMYQDIGINEFQDQESESDEDLESATRNNAEKTFLGLKVIKSEEPVLSLSKKPEVIDDFIRNFLSSKNLLRTLDTFQNEWYEHQQLGKLTVEDTNIVPDVYKRNQDLSDAVQKLRIDVENYKEIASKARATYDKLRKERDFHRMHHKRVVQEKGKLINDIKKLKEDYDSFEPTLKQIQHKYEIAMKEKMLTKLERDKLASKVVLLDTSLKSARDEIEGKPKSATPKKRVETKEASFPIEDRKPPAVVVSTPNLEKLHQTASINAHSTAISSIKFHPTKQIIATTSDDKTWKMFAFPTGDAIMTAQGHRDWISDCDFHPNGTQIATSSGDKTVKIWDFIRGTAIMTLSDHTSAVWSCAYHYTGDFLVSASMDHTSKLWDLKTYFFII